MDIMSFSLVFNQINSEYEINYIICGIIYGGALYLHGVVTYDLGLDLMWEESLHVEAQR